MIVTLTLNADAWLRTVQEALHDVNDQILPPLGCFDEVRLEDRLAKREEVIMPGWEQDPVPAYRSSFTPTGEPALMNLDRRQVS